MLLKDYVMLIKTWETYKAMFVIHMAFCEITSNNFAYPSEITVITFIKLLCFNGLLLFKITYQPLSPR